MKAKIGKLVTVEVPFARGVVPRRVTGIVVSHHVTVRDAYGFDHLVVIDRGGNYKPDSYDVAQFNSDRNNDIARTPRAEKAEEVAALVEAIKPR